MSNLATIADPRAYIPPPVRPDPAAPEVSKTGRRERAARPPTPLWAHAVLLPNEAIPPLYDLPLEVVERVLYGSDEDDDSRDRADVENDDDDLRT